DPVGVAGDDPARVGARPMTAADGILLVIGAGVVAYAVLGGADFGGGVWDLLAAGPRRDAQRRLIPTPMGPVGEATHGWLVFAFMDCSAASRSRSVRWPGCWRCHSRWHCWASCCAVRRSCSGS